MATLKQIFQIMFETQGATQATEQTDRLDRSVTRLGQSSASAGRKFSSQASGLGGLVGIYAAAAATVYALEAAFTALSNAAAAENIIKGTNTLAAAYGQSGPKILRSIRDITDAQISMAESAELANLAISSGFNSTQIERLANVANKASKALGRNLSDSMNRITRGAVKMEAELLDELGIFTKIGPATTAYAQSIGVAVTSLTDFERRQAFLNAVLDEGERKYASIDTSLGSTQKTLEQLVVSLKELGTGFLQVIGNAVAPFVSWIKDNAGVELLAFAGIIALVFSKLLYGVEALAGKGISKLASFANKLSAISHTFSASPRIMAEAITQMNEAIAARKGIGGQGLDRNTSGSFSKTGISVADSSAAAQARKRFINNKIAPIGSEQRAKDIAAIQKVHDAMTKSTNAAIRNSEAVKDTTRMLAFYSSDAAKASKATMFFSAAAEGAAKAASLLSKALAGLNVVIGIISTLVVAYQMLSMAFGKDPIGDWFKGLKEKRELVKSLEEGLVGLSLAASGGTAAVSARLKNAGLTDSQIETFGDTLIEKSKEINDTVISNLVTPRNYDTVANTAISVVKDVSEQFVVPLNITFSAKVAKKESLTQQQIQAETLLELQKRLSESRSELAGTAITDVGTRLQLQEEVIAYEVLIEKTKQYGGALDLVAGEIAMATGINKVAVAEVLSGLNTIPGAVKKVQKQLGNKTVDTVSIFGLDAQVTKEGIASLHGMTEAQKEYFNTGTATLNIEKELTEQFNSGAINLEEYTAKLAAMRTNLDQLKNAAPNVLRDTLIAMGIPQKALGVATAQVFDEAEARYKELEKQQEQYRNATMINKGVTKQFSSAINAIPSLPFSGLFSLAGQIAKDTNTQLSNQIDYLKEIVIEADKINTKDGTSNELLEAGQKAREAIKGLLIQNVQAIAKEYENQKKLTKELDKQLVLLKLQNALSLQKAQQQLDATIRANNIKNAELELQLLKENISLSIKKADNEQKAAEALLKIEKDKQKYLSEQIAGVTKLNNSYQSFLLSIQALSTETHKPITVDLYSSDTYNEQSKKLQEAVIANESRILREKLDAERIRFANNQSNIIAESDLIQNRITAQKEIHATQNDALDKEKNIALSKLQSARDTLLNEKANLVLQRNINLEQAAQQRDSALSQLDNAKALSKAFDKLTGAAVQFQLIVEDLADIFGKVDPKAFAGYKTKSGQTDFITAASNLQQDFNKLVSANDAKIWQQYDSRKNSIIDIYKLETQNNQEKIGQIDKEITATKNLYGVKKQLLSETQAAEIADLNTKLQGLDKSTDYTKYMSILADSLDAINDKFQDMQNITETLKGNMRDIAIESAAVDLQFSIDKAALNREINMINAEQELERLNLQVELVQAKVASKAMKPVAGATEENRLQKEILAQRRAIVELEYTNAIEANREKKVALIDQKNLDLANITNKENQLKSQIDRDVAFIQAQVDEHKAFLTQQETVSQNSITAQTASHNNFISALIAAFNEGARALGTSIVNANEGILSFDAATPTIINDTVVEKATDALSRIALTARVEGAITKATVEVNAEAERELVNKKHDNAIKLLDREDEKEKLVRDNKIANLTTQYLIEDELAKKRLKDAKDQGKEQEKLTGRLKDLQSGFSSTIESALMGLNDLLFYGEGTFSEVLGGFFKALQQEVMSTTIVKPIAETLSNWVTGAFSKAVGGTDIMGSPLAGVVGSAVGATGKTALEKNVMGPAAFDAGSAAVVNLGSTISAASQQAVMQIQSAGQQIATAMSGLGMQTQASSQTAGMQAQTGGTQLASSIATTGQQVATGTVAAGTAIGTAGVTFTSLLQSFWPILLMMGVTALFSKKNASGGAVQQLAAGGGVQQLAAGGASLRDRVPSLLEPGEFVIRKPAARKIGTPALQQLNATGNAGGMGNVQVNVSNQGAPKDAVVSKPKFDGDKYIIDVVTRDLSNNGPIRRSLRGNR